MQIIDDSKIIERAVDKINENIDDDRIPKNIRDMLKNKMGRNTE